MSVWLALVCATKLGGEVSGFLPSLGQVSWAIHMCVCVLPVQKDLSANCSSFIFSFECKIIITIIIPSANLQQ